MVYGFHNHNGHSYPAEGRTPKQVARQLHRLGSAGMTGKVLAKRHHRKARQFFKQLIRSALQDL